VTAMLGYAGAMRVGLALGVVLALVVTGCTSGHAAGAAAGSTHPAATQTRTEQRQLRLLRQQLFNGVDQAWADEATAVLSIAHACSPAGIAGGAVAYRQCQARHQAGSESIGDNGLFPGTEAFTAFVTTSATYNSVVSTLVNSKTTPIPCREALNQDGQSWNYADRAIEPLHLAEQAENFASVRRIATVRTIEHLRELIDAGRRAVRGAC
jgi:hypothetical protein